jgi:hypothetical protein
MKYRMYCRSIKIGSVIVAALSVSACATNAGMKNSNERQTAPLQADETDGGQNTASGFDGREPSSMKGDFTWLNDVEDEFGRVAAETSSRAVASQNKQEVLMKQKEWAFSFLPKTNHFSVDLQGTQYQMVQTKIDDGERFAFAAENQTENPLTFAVTKGEGRQVASGGGLEGDHSYSCTTEISYWSKSAKAYLTERKSVSGKPCSRMLQLLKDYVP